MEVAKAIKVYEAQKKAKREYYYRHKEQIAQQRRERRKTHAEAVKTNADGV
jgi:hypothetical protein